MAVPNAYSQAWRLGRTVLEAQEAQTDPVAAVVQAENGRVLFVGKVVDVTRTAGAKTSSFLHDFIARTTKKPNACQDRLGTNIGKALKNKYVFLLVQRIASSLAMP